MFGLPLEIDPRLGIAICLIGYLCVANLVRLVCKKWRIIKEWE